MKQLLSYKFVFTSLFIYFIIIFTIGFFAQLPTLAEYWHNFIGIGLGIFIYILFYWLYTQVLKKKAKTLFGTFTHELTHAITAILCLKKVTEFNVRNSAHNNRLGHISHQGHSNWVLTLSPYFLPIYTLFFVGISFFMQSKYQVFIDFIIGFTYAFHLKLFIRTAKPYQEDIKKYGLFFSRVFILFCNIAILLWLLLTKGVSFKYFCDFVISTIIYSVNLIL